MLYYVWKFTELYPNIVIFYLIIPLFYQIVCFLRKKYK